MKWLKLKESKYLDHLTLLNFLIGASCTVLIKARNYGKIYPKTSMFWLLMDLPMEYWILQ